AAATASEGRVQSAIVDGVARLRTFTRSSAVSSLAGTIPRLVVKNLWAGVQRTSMPFENRSFQISFTPVTMYWVGDVTTTRSAGPSLEVASCVYTPKVSPSTTRRMRASKRTRPLSVWTRESPVKQGFVALVGPAAGEL